MVSLLVISLVGNVWLWREKNTLESQVEEVKVLGTIDGDTIVVGEKTRIRLRYIDAPEKDKCGYEEATKELNKLTKDKTVRIAQVVPDQYGRGMAMVYLDGKSINELMLATGWVRYHSDITSDREEMKAAAQKAEDEKLGVYGKCQSKTNLKNTKCVIKGNIDFAINKKTYHLPGCAQYESTMVQEDKGEAWFCTESEARKAGYEKSQRCK